MTPTPFPIPAVTMSKGLMPMRPLFEAAAAGLVSLPERVVAEMAALAKLDKVLADAPRPPDDPAAGVSDELIRLAHGDGELPNVDAVARQLGRWNAHAVMLEATRTARERVEWSLLGALSGSAAEFVTEHLAPAHERVVTELRATVKALTDHGAGIDAQALLQAPQEVRAARERLTVLAATYERLRVCHAAVEPWLPRPELDVDGRFVEMRNAMQIWPRVSPAETPPWPTADPVARLAWLLSHGAELWLPTARQRDEAWAKAFPDAPVLRGRPVGWAATGGDDRPRPKVARVR
jgi:hypothetical protein